MPGDSPIFLTAPTVRRGGGAAQKTAPPRADYGARPQSARSLTLAPPPDTLATKTAAAPQLS